MTVSVMLDLETWGKRPGCDIRSIGAVVFDPVYGVVGSNDNTFYIATDNPFAADKYYTNAAFEHRRYPLRRDPETVKWWSEQSPEAQAAFVDLRDLKDALEEFSDWLHSMTENEPDGIIDIRVWANDPHFDVSILQAAFDAVGLDEPWHYRSPRSMKTATDLAGLTRDEYVTATVPHHALHDAIAQAGTICKCYERLGLSVTA